MSNEMDVHSRGPVIARVGSMDAIAVRRTSTFRKSPVTQSLTWATILFAFAVTSTVGCSENQNTLPIHVMAATNGESVSQAATSSKPEIVHLGQRLETHGSETFVVSDFVLVNPLEVPITYRGYRMDSWETRPKSGEISPLYQLKVKDNAHEEWRDVGVGWCGTGAGEMIIRPKEAGRFQARIAKPAGFAQIGFACTWPVKGRPTTTEVWSPTIGGSQQ